MPLKSFHRKDCSAVAVKEPFPRELVAKWFSCHTSLPRFAIQNCFDPWTKSPVSMFLFCGILLAPVIEIPCSIKRSIYGRTSKSRFNGPRTKTGSA
jgi:hypothetical protein